MQPFQEADVIAAQEGAASPWACLQKTYSNVEEHVQSTTEGQLQQSNVEGLAAAKEDHHASAMGMIDQVSTCIALVSAKIVIWSA